MKNFDFYKGTAIAKNDVYDYIKSGDGGIITAYLPDDNTFAIYFGKSRWYTFHDTEEWFLNNFNIINEELENVNV